LSGPAAAPLEQGTAVCLAVDIGGTKLAVGLVDSRGAIVSRDQVATPKTTEGAQLFKTVSDLIELALAGAGALGVAVTTCGVGSGGPMLRGGVAVSPLNIAAWRDFPLRSELEGLPSLAAIPVFVDNDATVAALAEAHDNDLRLVARNLVMFTLGTGFGGGLVLGGRIYRGATGAAAEVGHMLVAVDVSNGVPAPSGFPQPGSIESLAAGRALDRMAYAIGFEGGGPDAVQAARDGDPEAGAIVERWARLVGIAIANAINIFDPDEVVLGGGAASAAELLLGPAREAALVYVLPGVGSTTRIRLARHGVRAGVLGAALLAAHELSQTVA